MHRENARTDITAGIQNYFAACYLEDSSAVAQEVMLRGALNVQFSSRAPCHASTWFLPVDPGIPGFQKTLQKCGSRKTEKTLPLLRALTRRTPVSSESGSHDAGERRMSEGELLKCCSSGLLRLLLCHARHDLVPQELSKRAFFSNFLLLQASCIWSQWLKQKLGIWYFYIKWNQKKIFCSYLWLLFRW